MTFDPPKRVQILTWDQKTHYQSRVLVESNPLFFPLSSTTLSFQTRGGVASPPVRPRYEIGRVRARVKVYLWYKTGNHPKISFAPNEQFFFKVAAGTNFVYTPPPGTSQASWAVFLLVCIIFRRVLSHMVQQSPSNFRKWCSNSHPPICFGEKSWDHPWNSPLLKSSLQGKFNSWIFTLALPL